MTEGNVLLQEEHKQEIFHQGNILAWGQDQSFSKRSDKNALSVSFWTYLSIQNLFSMVSIKWRHQTMRLGKTLLVVQPKW